MSDTDDLNSPNEVAEVLKAKYFGPLVEFGASKGVDDPQAYANSVLYHASLTETSQSVAESSSANNVAQKATQQLADFNPSSTLQLKPQQETVAMMRVFFDLDQQETAQAMGLAKSDVEKIENETRVDLAKFLGRKYSATPEPSRTPVNEARTEPSQAFETFDNPPDIVLGTAQQNTAASAVEFLGTGAHEAIQVPALNDDSADSAELDDWAQFMEVADVMEVADDDVASNRASETEPFIGPVLPTHLRVVGSDGLETPSGINRRLALLAGVGLFLLAAVSVGFLLLRSDTGLTVASDDDNSAALAAEDNPSDDQLKSVDDDAHSPEALRQRPSDGTGVPSVPEVEDTDAEHEENAPKPTTPTTQKPSLKPTPKPTTTTAPKPPPPTSGTVSGRIVQAHGSPATALQLAFKSAAGTQRTVKTNSNGNYSLGGLPFGCYTVSVRGTNSFQACVSTQQPTVNRSLLTLSESLTSKPSICETENDGRPVTSAGLEIYENDRTFKQDYAVFGRTKQFLFKVKNLKFELQSPVQREYNGAENNIRLDDIYYVAAIGEHGYSELAECRRY